MLTLTLISCDLLQSLEFENQSESNAKVTIVLHKNVDYRFLREQFKGDSLLMDIAPKMSDGFEFGIGVWSDDEIKAVTTTIKSIEIASARRTVRYDSQNQLERLFRENLKGFKIRNEIKVAVD